LDVNATYDQERIARPMLALHDLHFQKKFKLIGRNVIFQISDSHDEKSGIILEEKRDVPLVHR